MTDIPKGIVVLGFPRSGTTLLRRILNAHPDIACPGETCIFSACARFMHSELVSDGLEFGVLNGLAFAGVEPSQTLRRLREFAFTFCEDHARMQTKRRWAEKTAVDIFHLEKIEQLCGSNVQYVCIVRHGLDVAISLQEFSERGFGYLSEIHEYVKHYPRPMEAFTYAWADVNARLLEFLERQGTGAVLLRYEDLISDPMKHVKKLFEFLGETVDETILSRAFVRERAPGLGDWKAYAKEKIDDGSIQRWRSLPPFIIGRLGHICNPVLREFAYDEVPVRAVDNQEKARRKYELALMFGGVNNSGNSPD